MNRGFSALRKPVVRFCDYLGFMGGVISLSMLISSSAFAQAVDGGKFGRALKIEQGSYVAVPYNQAYFCMPMTVECWVKLPAKAPADGIILSCGPRHSNEHWEIYATGGDGALNVSFGGYTPKQVKSSAIVADGAWHFVAMTFDGQSVQLFLDGKQSASQALTKVGPYPDLGPLTFGSIEGNSPVIGGLIDEVRISRVTRVTDKVPAGPFTVDADTVGLWHFDEDAKAYDKTGFADASSLHIPARTELMSQDVQAPGGFDGTRGPHTRWHNMDVGNFFTSTLGVPKDQASTTSKAISIRIGKDKKHAIAFDTDLLRVSLGWTGDFVKMYDRREGLAQHPDIAGELQFKTASMPGWSRPRTPAGQKAEEPVDAGDFIDPRPDKLGPLPAQWAKYKGFYVHGDRTILSYSVGDEQVLEMPWADDFDNQSAFTRTFEISPSKQTTTLRVCDASGFSSVAVARGEWRMTRNRDEYSIIAAIVEPAENGLPPAVLQSTRQILTQGDAHTMVLKVPPHDQTIRFKVLMWFGLAKDRSSFDRYVLSDNVGVEPLALFTHDGPPRFPEPIITKGTLGKPDPKSDGAYVIDTLTVPDDNPWKSFIRLSGIDFFKNGDAAVCSISGDVWVVSGIDDKLDKLKWRRFATGLFQPLGLKIVDDTVYVLGRDQITRLHDQSGTGEADFYECFNNECKVTPDNGHAYTTCLETDSAGNFYFCKCGDSSSQGGTVLKVDRYGNNLEVFATGVRNPNGLGGGPNGLVTEADNEGEWVPASRIDIVKKGTFLGFTPMSHTDTPPTDPGKPIVWMPQDVDNSSGGQTWVKGDKWGLPDGEMIHTSYGAAALLHVMTEEIDGITQGGVYRFPFRFGSGIMRARFRENDGQLYVCGLRGWQTAGVQDGALQRLRYTGKSLHQPASIHIHANGIVLGFTCALDNKTAADAGSFSVLQWNYKWSAAYGSRFWSVRNPAKQGFDEVEVKSATLLPDGKSIFLEIPDLRPAMTTKITCALDAADGFAIQQDVHCTIHVMGKAFSVKPQ